jgi:type II restriction enzyme
MSKNLKKQREYCAERIAIEDLVEKIKNADVPLAKTHEIWEQIYSYKKAYMKSESSQSWNSYIGRVFQRIIYYVLKRYIAEISQTEQFNNLALFTEEEIDSNDFLHQKLSIKYGKKERVLPDADMVIADYYHFDQNKSVIVAIVSCKTSLRERIAQACYWKLKLLSSDSTKHIRVFLATSDNDKDFDLDENGDKSRDRIIAEYELDGVYILKDNFRHEWESQKIKHYERVFEDLVNIFKQIRKKPYATK